MATLKITQLLILLNLGTLLLSLACPTCPPTHPPKVKPPPKLKPPPKVKPPPKPPTPETPCPPPPKVKPPPSTPKSPPMVKPPPSTPKSPPTVKPPPSTPKSPPTVNPPPTTPKSPPSPKPKPQETCPIDTLKLGACVDVLGGLINIGLGGNQKEACCPVLQGLVDLDAAICLCTAIKAKLLNLNILVPIALQVLVDCGKNPPSGFQCPA